MTFCESRLLYRLCLVSGFVSYYLGWFFLPVSLAGFAAQIVDKWITSKADSYAWL
jgi:hypothetical protein